MRVELRVPAVGESITEVMVGAWHKNAGDSVAQDETLVEIESDKATLELPAPAAGTLAEILKPANSNAVVGEVIGFIETEAAAVANSKPAALPTPAAAPKPITQPPAAAPPVAAAAPSAVTPSARRVLAESGLQPSQVPASGPGGRLLKEDVIRYQQQGAGGVGAAPMGRPRVAQGRDPYPIAGEPPAPPHTPPARVVALPGGGEEEIVPMSPIRRRIAERLLEAQHNAALLTTFNEIDMGAVLALRQAHQERFQQRYGVKLGFMSFFVKAAIEALKLVPQVNAEIRGTDIVYKNYFDIGIAIGGGKGLVVPVLRGAHLLSFAEIELAIADFAARAQASKLDLEELKGGTFTISNGGVYGSMLSTPIVNPPQSGVLGLHAIKERAVVVNGLIVARPMMYVALSYDHRMVDGREGVTFLNRVKETIEDPARILLEI